MPLTGRSPTPQPSSDRSRLGTASKPPCSDGAPRSIGSPNSRGTSTVPPGWCSRSSMDSKSLTRRGGGYRGRRHDRLRPSGGGASGRYGCTADSRTDRCPLCLRERRGDARVRSRRSVAMLLGAATLLAAAPPSGTVRLLFQPAEEDAPVGGAGHVGPSLDPGTVGVACGLVTANSDRFRLSVRGRVGHASMPAPARDAVVACGELVVSLQQLVARSIAADESAVLSVGRMQAGQVPNAIAADGFCEGTIRTLTPAVRTVMTGCGRSRRGSPPPRVRRSSWMCWRGTRPPSTRMRRGTWPGRPRWQPGCTRCRSPQRWPGRTS